MLLLDMLRHCFVRLKAILADAALEQVLPGVCFQVQL